MRENKFRVWDILNKRMLEWENIFDLPAWEIFTGTPEQRPFVVVQYTGLKDMNEKEIYECDIVQIGENGYKYEVVIGEVYTGKFVTYGVGLKIIGEIEATYAIDIDDLSELKVVGNVFENSNGLLQKNKQKETK